MHPYYILDILTSNSDLLLSFILAWLKYFNHSLLLVRFVKLVGALKGASPRDYVISAILVDRGSGHICGSS